MSLKILWFYKYIRTYDYDNWLHLKFVEVMKRHPGLEVMAYGPDIHVGYPHLTTLHYNKKHTIDDIKKHFDFDAIILNTKSRMFGYYDPHPPTPIAKDEWLPKGYCVLDVPKIVIEEDYHYERNDDWYRENRIDVILQRHYSQFLRQQTVKMQWFPFSVDVDVFHPGQQIRRPKICFSGSINKDVYKPRWTACEALKSQQMIDVFSGPLANGKQGMAYVNCLREYVSHLSCSSIYKITPAKIFEIMASGSALLTNENEDLPLLFPNGGYYTYKTDNSNKVDSLNVIQVAREIISDSAHRAEVVQRGLDTIRTHHSHQVRINELVGIINTIRSGK